jgi:exodeoxyribonuclease V alpha subunit
MPITTPHDTLRGELLSFAPKTPDGWGVGVLAVADGKRATVTGRFVGCSVGDSLECSGQWQDTAYGRQFRVTACTTTDPQSADAVCAWLCRALPDIGQARARDVVARYGHGDQLWATLEHAPESLTEIAGITAPRAERIGAAYREQRADRAALVTLYGWGLTYTQIGRCVAEYDTLTGTIAAIRADPYQLIDTIHGVGFRRADALALRIGLATDSPYRIMAALRHVLYDSAQTHGHCYLPSGALVRMTAALLALPGSAVAPMLGRAGVVLRDDRAYLRHLHRAETDAAATLLQLCARARTWTAAVAS